MPRLVRCLLIVLLALGSLCVVPVGPAQAQTSDAALKEARKMFQQALELEQAGNWGGALQLFREVSQVKMTPQVRFHIALCEENLGKLVAALGGYELALADAEQVGGTFIAEVEANITKLRARIPKLVIERGKGAEAAKIELDGIELGSSSIGIEVPLDPGPHQIVATAQGYEDFTDTVLVEEEKVTTLEITMKKLPKGAPPPTGGGGVVDPGPQVEPKKPKVVPISLMAGGGGLMLVSGAFFLLREINLSDVESACPDGVCPVGTNQDSLNKKRNKANTFTILSGISAGVGVAAIGTGVVLLVMDKKADDADAPKKKAALRLVPAGPEGEPGLTLHGRF